MLLWAKTVEAAEERQAGIFTKDHFTPPKTDGDIAIVRVSRILGTISSPTNASKSS
jgi:hypothetical protein